MMWAEISRLLETLPPTAAKTDYWSAVIQDNLLDKKTASTRRLTAQRLTELYALDLSVPVFRLLRHFWSLDREGRPLLAFLCASARDPLLRLTAKFVLETPEGSPVPTESLDKLFAEAVPGRFNASIRGKVARNSASSWAQSGHLKGRLKKMRTQPVVTPANTAYALALGYLAGARGVLLLHGFWVSLLASPYDRIAQMAHEASRRGWLTYRAVGKIVEVRFPESLILSAEGHAGG
jgi:hypothetical protein